MFFKQIVYTIDFDHPEPVVAMVVNLSLLLCEKVQRCRKTARRPWSWRPGWMDEAYEEEYGNNQAD